MSRKHNKNDKKLENRDDFDKKINELIKDILANNYHLHIKISKFCFPIYKNNSLFQ